MVEQRPQAFTVEYNGMQLQFERGRDDSHCYYFRCPKCDARHGAAIFGRGAILVEGPDGWTLSFDDQGRATVRPSILCGMRWGTDTTECGWHVWITDGVARDC